VSLAASCLYAPHGPARLTGRRVVFSISPFVCYQTHNNCSPGVFNCQTCQPVLMPTGTSGQWGKDIKQSTLGSGGQRSRSRSHDQGQGHMRPQIDWEDHSRHI